VIASVLCVNVKVSFIVLLCVHRFMLFGNRSLMYVNTSLSFGIWNLCVNRYLLCVKRFILRVDASLLCKTQKKVSFVSEQISSSANRSL